MRTKTELRNDVLVELTVLSVGENASAEDAAFVETKIDQVHGELEELGLVGWPVDEIPDNVTQGYVWIVADRCKTAFGQGGNGELSVNAERGIRAIRKQTSPGFSGEPIEAEYF